MLRSASKRKRSDNDENQAPSKRQEPNPATPARPVDKGAAPPAMSPTRATRLSEKLDLQDLNKRLEICVMRQREKDAAMSGIQEQINKIRRESEDKFKKQQEIWEKEIDSLRHANDDQTAEIAEISEARERLANEAKVMAAEIARLKAQRDGAEKRCVDLSSKLASANTARLGAEEDNKKLHHQLEVDETEIDNLHQELEKAKDAARIANAKLAAAENKAVSLQEDLDVIDAKTSKELKELRARIAKLAKERDILEENLRKEFGTQLKELLAQRQEEFDREKEEGLARLKEQYDKQAALTRASMDQLGRDNTALREKIAEQQEEIAALRANGNVSALEAKVFQLQQELGQSHAEHKANIHETNLALSRIRQRLKEKDEDFDALMDIKVALAMEIKAYRTMLDAEETRLGFGTPVKEKKKPSRITFASSLIISAMDWEGQSATIRNGSADEISLAGWVLRSEKTKKKFEFDDLNVGPGKSVTVWMGAKAEEMKLSPDRKETDLLWPITNMWKKSGDAAQLLSPDKRIVSHVSIIATTTRV